jgi:hypothetical protein
MKQALAAGLLIAVLLSIPSTGHSAVYYVPDDYGTIQAALNDVVGGDTIIVRDGTYSGAGSADIDFMNKAVTLMSENGPGSCTIDASGADRGFVFWRGETSASVLDGFTITNGNTGYGAGIYMDSSSPTIMNCVIANNSATVYGGALFLSSSSPSLVNCTLVGNTASTGGGAITCISSAPDITHCTISDNNTVSGGGIQCNASSPTIVNSVLWGNAATEGDEIWLYGSSVASVSYSDVAGGQAGAVVYPGATLNWGAGNMNSDPKFVGGDDFHLTLSSPCVDMGMDAGVYTDIDDDPRPFASGYDMGSDETTQEPLALSTVNLVSPSDGSLLSEPPTFFWAVDGGSSNQYSIDFALTPRGPFIFSSWDRIRLVIVEENISTNPLLWAGVPSGTTWYWRVRGADTSQSPLAIVTSAEVWSFTKN